MAGGPLQAADDMVRIITNGMTFGLADKGISKITGQDEAALTAAARERAGVAGDIASVLGYGGGAKAVFSGGKAAIKAVPAIARSVLSKKGAAAALLGIGSLAEYNSRTGTGQAQATPTKTPAAAAAAQAASKPRSTVVADRATDDIMSSLNAVDSTPPTFEDMAHQVAAGQGGISLRQLGALSEVAKNTALKPAKPANPAYETQQRLQSYYAGVHQRDVQRLGQEQADANYAASLEGLMKLSATDSLIRNQRYDDEGN